MTRLVFKWYDFASEDETEIDMDDADNQCDNMFHTVEL